MSLQKFKKQENIGVALILIGIAGFFISMWAFNLFGAKIDFSVIMPQALVPLIFLTLGISGIGYAAAGKRGVINAASIFGFLIFVAVVFRLIMNAIETL